MLKELTRCLPMVFMVWKSLENYDIPCWCKGLNTSTYEFLKYWVSHILYIFCEGWGAFSLRWKREAFQYSVSTCCLYLLFFIKYISGIVELTHFTEVIQQWQESYKCTSYMTLTFVTSKVLLVDWTYEDMNHLFISSL